MTLYGGKKQRITFSKETDWGTDPAAGERSIGMLQGTPTVTGDNQTVNVFSGGRINSRALLDGTFNCGAKFDYFMQDGAFAIGSIGDFDTTSPTLNTANYVHIGGTEDTTSTTTTPVEYEVVPYTMKFGVSGATKNITLTGCKTNSISFNFTLNEPARASVEVFGQKITTDIDVQTVTELAETPYMYHRKGTLNWDSSPITTVTDLNFSVSNSLKRGEGMSDDRYINGLEQGDRIINGNVTLNYDGSETQIADALGGTTPTDSETFDIDILLDNELTETLVTYRGLKFDVKDVRIGSLERSHPIDGDFISETYGFTAPALDINYFDATASDPW